MSNPARNLLNYIDEHKEEMKDNTYIGIVERIVPINKICEEKPNVDCKLFFLVVTPTFDIDENIESKNDIDVDVVCDVKTFECCLHKDLYKKITTVLSTIGIMKNVFAETSDMKMLTSVFSLLQKHFEHKCMEDMDIIWHNNVSLIRCEKI